jgi:hypothetical protein
MNLISKLLLLIAVPALALTVMVSQANAFNLFGQTCDSATNTSPTCQQAQNQGGQSTNKLTGTKNIIQVAANIIAIITGIAAVIMIIISGIKFMTAGGTTPGQRSGDTNAVKSAQATLTAAVIGLIIVALAWTITRFITDNLIK